MIAPRSQLHDDEQTADAAIAVRERMELELVVRHRGLHDRWDLRRVPHPREQRFDARPELIASRRGDESRCLQATTPRTDHDDAVPQASEVRQLAACAVDELLLQVAEEPER